MSRFIPALSLRGRLMALVLLAALPALALTLYTAAESRQREASQAEAEALRLIQLISASQEREIEGARNLLIALAQLQEVRQADSAACGARLNEFLTFYPGYTGLGAARANGDVICAATPLTQPVNVGDRVWFQRAVAAKDFAVGDYQVGQLSGQAILVFGYPQLDDAGDVAVVVFAALQLDTLNQIAAEAHLPEGAVLLVIDRHGTVMDHFPRRTQYVGQVLPDQPVIAAILAQQEGVDERPGLDGVQRLYAFTPLRSTFRANEPGAQADATGIYLALGIPLQAAYAASDQLFARNLSLLGLVSLLALAAAWLGGEVFVLRRVRALLGATERLRRGDLSARSGVARGPNELSQLASAFDEMAEALEQRETALQAEREGLRVSRDEIAAILDAIAEGVTVQAPSGSLVYANDLAARMIGFETAAQLLAAPVDGVTRSFDLFDETGQPLALDRLPGRRALLGEAAPAALVRFRIRRTGQEHWSNVKARPIFDGQGRVVMAVNIFHDITPLKRAEQDQRLLAEAGRALASSLDYQDRLARLARLALPHLADWCIVDIVQPDGSLRQVAAAHVDPDKEALVRELRQAYPPGEDHPLLHVARTGRPDFDPDISEAELATRAHDARHLDLLRAVGIRAHIVIPLVARGRTLGVISFVRGEASPGYDQSDLALAEELARRAALSVDNARLYSDAQALNTDLERRVAERTEELETALAELQAANLELESEIIERQRVEADLEGSISILEATFESTADGLLVVDPRGKIVRFNQRFADMWRIPDSVLATRDDDQALAFVLSQLKHPEAFLAKVREVYAQPDVESFDVLEFHDGRMFERTSLPHRVAGQSAGRVWSFRDVTERQRNQEALAVERDLLQALMDNIPDSIYFKDTQSRFTRINQAQARVLGVAHTADAIGKTDFDFQAEDLAQGFYAEEQQIVRTGQPLLDRIEYNPTADGQPRWFSATKVPLRGPDGRITGLVGISRNITERMLAEAQLRSSHEQLQALSWRLQDAREEERTRISREVHDELGGALTGIKMDLTRMQKSAQGLGLDMLLDKFDAMMALIDTTVQTVRRIATELRPALLDDFGLLAAIEWQLQEFQKRSGLECVFTTSVDEVDLDSDSATAVFRVFQETLTNVARHAQASRVEVSLDIHPGYLVLQVRDDGRGISEAEIAGSASLGLVGMRERVRLLAGELDIHGRPGRGTTVLVKIPLGPRTTPQAEAEAEPQG